MHHFHIPSFTTDSVGTGTLLQWGRTQTRYGPRAGLTKVAIDTVISSFQISVTTNTSDIATL